MKLEALRMAYDEIKKGKNTKLFREVVQKIDGHLGPSAWYGRVDRRVEQKKEKLENKLNAYRDKLSTSNLKIALIFTRLVLSSHFPSIFHPYVKALSSPVLDAVGERYYKVTAEALRVCGELVLIVRPSMEGIGFAFKPYVHPIYNAIMSRLTNQDQDQEVKECAISCMGLVVSTFGDNLKAELPACLHVLVDRMGNEITKLTVVKAFAVIATFPLQIDLSCVLEQVIAELHS